MVIDAHQHFWEFDPVRDAWITEDMHAIRKDFLPNDLLQEMKRNGVDGCIAVQADQSEAETAFLAQLAQKDDFIKGIVGWTDLRDPFLQEQLVFHSTSGKIKGFRHVVQAEPDDNFLLGKEFCAGIAQLKQFGFTYDILVYPRQLPAAVKFTEKFPDQSFVIDHIAKPLIKEGRLQPWAEHMKELARHPNVYCKVSGMVTEADWKHWKEQDFMPYLDLVFEAFGTERIMFGSDWPVCLIAAEYRQVKGIVESYISRFSEREQAAVMGGNAVKFYNL